MKSNRLLGLDVLRILSITLITIIHFIGYSDILMDENISTFNYVAMNILDTLTVIAVNIFVLITGFFNYEKKLNIKRLLSMWIKIVLISIVLLIVALIFNRESISITTIIKTFFPFSTMHYWFFSMYIILCLLQPILNVLISNIEKKVHFRIIVIGLLILSVYFVLNPFIKSEIYIANDRGVIWFVYLYLVGAFINKYKINISKKVVGIISLLLFAVVFILKYFSIESIANIYLLESNSIIPFLLSLLCFIFFKNINMNNKVVNKIIVSLASCSFWVYIIQEHDGIRYWFWQLFSINSFASSPLLILICLGIVLLLWLIAFVLHKILIIFNPIIDKIYNFLVNIKNKIYIRRDNDRQN